MAATAVLRAEQVGKSFGATVALRQASIQVAAGEIVAVMGPSGSGKSTLLHCLAGVFTPDRGTVWFADRRLDTLSDADRTRLRRTAFGFVFQFGQLVPELTAIDNIALPLLLDGVRRRTAYARAAAWFVRLELDGLQHRRTGELSGGEAQRVAVARALVTGPRVLFADEPTGSLDSQAGGKVMDLLVAAARAEGTAVVLVTHDPGVAAHAGRQVLVQDGILVDPPTAAGRPADGSPDTNAAPLAPAGRGEPVSTTLTTDTPQPTDPGHRWQRRGAGRPTGPARLLGLGVQLAARTGREAAARMAVTAAAVAVGVSLLLSVLGLYHAYQATIARPCWQCTQQTTTSPATLLWNFRLDYYRGQLIQRLDVAALAPTTPVVPGLASMPPPGRFYASPALATLLSRTPGDQLGNRFPGTLAGTFGPAGLSGPDQLLIVVGHTAADLASQPGTLRVSHIDSAPRDFTTSAYYRFGFAMAAVVLLIPMLVLIGTATRLAAARREQRYAALRLVGATTAQVGVIASVEALIGALAGALAGIVGYTALHPALTGLSLTGSRFFPVEITPTGRGYAGVLIGVPIIAAMAALASLRRVGITPLGVARRVTPPAPTAWRLLPLAIGVPLFSLPLRQDPSRIRDDPRPAVYSLILVMAGLLIAGPWLTMRTARLLAATSRRGPALLAARRLADNPGAAYRTISGLVLAVMVATTLATLAPAAIAAQNTPQITPLADVLRTSFVSQPAEPTAQCAGTCPKPSAPRPVGLPPSQAASLIATLATLPGVHLIPMYYDHAASLITCTDLHYVPTLGVCPAGARAVLADPTDLFTDNLAGLNDTLPLVRPTSPPTTDTPTGRNLTALLATTASPAELEDARTILSRYAVTTDPDQTPQTFREVAHARASLDQQPQLAMTIVAGLTVLIAGCSLAVAVSGGIVERQRPFTLLRLTGTPLGALYRVVLLETVLPLLAATLVAAAVGFTVAQPVARALAPTSHTAARPDHTYYLNLGVGLALAITIILTCLPILRRTTATDNIRFE
jgi:ABC-type lipoprotein export system ATPase subunit